MRRAVLLLASLALVACSGHTGSGSGGAGTGNPDAPQVAIGPITLAPSQETTVCIVVPLGNAEDFVVRSVDVSLAPGSHHLIVYKTQDPEQTTPYTCTPFTDIAFGTDTPLVFANKEQVNWTFPDGVAQELPANTMVKIEAHYINASSSTLQGHGQVTFHGVPKSQAGSYQRADFVFWGTLNIDIPPNSSATTGQLFQAGIPGTHLISITTHQHRLGTGVEVWESKVQNDAVAKAIADDHDWANPSWTALAPQYDFDGNSGLTFQCDWTNTTDQTVQFGESALDEMCFVGGYYYPGNVLDLCINGHCKNR
jgi:hypothetical protein